MTRSQQNFFAFVMLVGFGLASVETAAVETQIANAGQTTQQKKPPAFDYLWAPRVELNGFLLRAQLPGPMVRCVTPAGSCFIPGNARPGTPCWCSTPYGPVAGRVG
jgi:hypothetical protein